MLRRQPHDINRAQEGDYRIIASGGTGARQQRHLDTVAALGRALSRLRPVSRQ